MNRKNFLKTISLALIAPILGKGKPSNVSTATPKNVIDTKINNKFVINSHSIVFADTKLTQDHGYKFRGSLILDDPKNIPGSVLVPIVAGYEYGNIKELPIIAYDYIGSMDEIMYNVILTHINLLSYSYCEVNNCLERRQEIAATLVKKYLG